MLQTGPRRTGTRRATRWVPLLLNIVYILRHALSAETPENRLRPEVCRRQIWRGVNPLCYSRSLSTRGVHASGRNTLETEQPAIEVIGFLLFALSGVHLPQARALPLVHPSVARAAAAARPSRSLKWRFLSEATAKDAHPRGAARVTPAQPVYEHEPVAVAHSARPPVPARRRVGPSARGRAPVELVRAASEP